MVPGPSNSKRKYRLTGDGTALENKTEQQRVKNKPEATNQQERLDPLTAPIGEMIDVWLEGGEK